MVLEKAAIVVPCYNESKRIDLSVFDYFIKENESFDFYFVNDGSIDNTADILSNYTKNHFSSNVFFIDYKKNDGKANCIRKTIISLSNTDYSFIGFIDSDNAIPISQIIELKKALDENKGKCIAITSRYINNGDTTKNIRFYLSKLYKSFVNRYIFKSNIHITDIQCGCKLLRKNIAEISFNEEFIGKWLFDTEIILRLRNNGFKISECLIEIPIKNLNNNDGSKISLWSKLKIFQELYLINKLYNS